MQSYGIGAVANLSNNILDRFWPKELSENNRVRAENEISSMILDFKSDVIKSQRDIIVSEMQQSDNYTRRARPTIVYVGLICIFLVHVVLPIFEINIALPKEFWWTWTGVCSVWIVGRSAEKLGKRDSIVKKIAG